MKLFFICFNSCFSSSSMMKLSYKCSNREPPSHASLSSSLSRKLRSSGSIRNGQASPMFPNVGKKKECALENPEPSSPKVTCIGQVRVKSRKKQGKKKMRTRSKTRNEASFRKTDQNLQQECLTRGNQRRRVHLPLAICETLRRFGAEFNHCFFPCWSSCSSSERDNKGVKKAGWLVALQEGEEERMDREESSERRHVVEVEDIDIGEEKKDEEEEKGRVSICIPPKNALLLMRCRSDPVKMAALANRFWESTDQNGEEEKEEEDTEIEGGGKQDSTSEEENLIPEAEIEAKPVVKGSEIGSREIPKLHQVHEEKGSEIGSREIPKLHEVDEVKVSEIGSREIPKLHGVDEVKCSEIGSRENLKSHEVNRGKQEVEDEVEERRVNAESKEEEKESKAKRETSVLPECLVLMMREPKLSMEVSKETWVCSTDFIQWLPDKPGKKRISIESKPPPPPPPPSLPPLPPRSSCSLPAPAAGISMKRPKSNACEPFVLTRCKSEPMRSSASEAAAATLGIGAPGVGF